MRAFLCTIIVLAVSALVPAKADVTDWTEVQGGAVRLIASGPIEDGSYLAGLEFLMDAGWHTYWRYPGEAGIPPQITLADAVNVKSIDVLYPVPSRYNDGFSESIVYHHGIVLPIRVTPENAAAPLRLALDVFFGICNEICVPGEAVLALDLTPNGNKDKLAEMLISRDLASVPGPSVGAGFGITSIALDTKEDAGLVITAEVPGNSAADLFAVGPEGSYIGLPKLVSHSGTTAVWHLSTKGLKGSPDGEPLRLVLKSGDAAIEHLEPLKKGWTN